MATCCVTRPTRQDSSPMTGGCCVCSLSLSLPPSPLSSLSPNISLLLPLPSPSPPQAHSHPSPPHHSLSPLTPATHSLYKLSSTCLPTYLPTIVTMVTTSECLIPMSHSHTGMECSPGCRVITNFILFCSHKSCFILLEVVSLCIIQICFY